MKELFGTLEELIHRSRETLGQLLFRGQPSARFDLRPSIGRQHPRYKPSARIEKNLLEQFKLKSRAYRNTAESNLDSLIIARHYGLRTRLLDWTSSIYTALYFAIEQRRLNEIFPISIYIAKNPPIVPYFSLPHDPFELKQTVFFEPPSLDLRIANQSAYLSIHDSPFEHFLPKYIERFSVFPNKQAVESIRQLLFDIGIRHSTIYPGLDGLCHDINDNPSTLEPQLLFGLEQSSWQHVPDFWIGKTGTEITKILIEDRSFVGFVKSFPNENLVGVPIEKNKRIIGRIFGYSKELNQIWLHSIKLNEVQEYNLDDPSLRKLQIPLETIDAFFPNRGITFIRKKSKRQ